MAFERTDSSTFIWRRIHSLMGFWLVIYLLEHLITNSQAALWIGDDGIGFVRLVNLLESLPYLQVVEWILIGIPLLVHGIWGVKRALTSRLNAYNISDGKPSLLYSRNQAYTWQRLSSWILLFGIIFHVIDMRFINQPKKVLIDNEIRYFNAISFDEGLTTLGPRLHVSFYTPQQIAEISAQPESKEKKWTQKLASFDLKPDEVVAESINPGTAMLLMVRDEFKSPISSILYTIFVLAASFHAFNGFWTFLITWGAILSYRSQKAMLPISAFGILLLSFLGLAAIWGSYWINLRN